MLYSGNCQQEFGQCENSNGGIIYLQHGGPDKQHHLFTGECTSVLAHDHVRILMSTFRSIVQTTSLSIAEATKYSSVSQLITLRSSLEPSFITFGRTGELYLVNLNCIYGKLRSGSHSRRDKIWESMSQQERLDYLATTKDKGNKRYAIRKFKASRQVRYTNHEALDSISGLLISLLSTRLVILMENASRVNNIGLEKSTDRCLFVREPCKSHLSHTQI